MAGLVNDTLAALIPARGPVELLQRSLSALKAAITSLGEPCAVRVCVNGWPIRDYAPLAQAFPEIEWLHCSRPLGFQAAIERLVAASGEDWLLLLNSDMRLHPDALAELWRCREDDVFALACQIEFADRQRRREETGWTAPVSGPDGQLELHDLLPPDDSRRGGCYAGGGASLYRADTLRAALPLSRGFRPFYFEDADWALQAWAQGQRVLFCPQARAVHEHRATISLFHDQATVQRIVARNLDLLRWRYGDLFGRPRSHGGFRDRLKAALRNLSPEHRAARQRVLEHPHRAALPWQAHQRQAYPQRWRRGHLRVLLVSPFGVLPPGHGGARRIVELARHSAGRLDLLLLHDEAPEQPAAASPEDALFRAIHPIGGRPPDDGSLESRWQAHAHPAMLAELQRLLDLGGFDVLAFEHVECIGVLEAVRSQLPIVWTLHDAGRTLPAAAAQRVQHALARVHTLVLTTAADLGHWQHPRQRCVINGVSLPDPAPAASSAPPGQGRLLMVAPLRYAPNREGLERLLDQVWPRLKRRFAALELRVLGGQNAQALWGTRPLPADVELIDGIVDPTVHYAWCTLALNPQGIIEGSALKLTEALAHGRIVVTTASGARGLDMLDSPALQRVADLSELTERVSEMLQQVGFRQAAEARARADVARFDWRHSASAWIELLREAAP